MRRLALWILLIAVLVVGGGLIAATAYQAGLSTAVSTAVEPGGTVVVPAYGYGFGWHLFGPGLGFLGFLGFLLFLFLVLGLIRAVAFGFGRRHWDGHGWGPGGREGYRSPWENRAHDAFEDWHRRAHDETARPDSTGNADPSSGTG